MRAIALLPVLFLVLALVVLVVGVVLVARRRASRRLLAVTAVCAATLLAAAWYSSATVVVRGTQCMAPMAVDDVVDGPTMATADVPLEDRLECAGRARAIVGGWTAAAVLATAGFAAAARSSRVATGQRATTSPPLASA